MLFMKYYEDNKMHSHLVNSTFDGKYYKKIDILKNKDVPNPKVKIHFPFLTSDLCKNFDLVYHDATNDELNEDLYFFENLSDWKNFGKNEPKFVEKKVEKFIEE